MRLWQPRAAGRRSSGSMRCAKITYRTTRNEATRCHFCKNNCLRTFIDIQMPEPSRRRESGSSRTLRDDRRRAGGRSRGPRGPQRPAPAMKSGPSARAGRRLIPVKFVSKVAKADDERRLIMATCEKGARRRRRRDARHQVGHRRDEEGRTRTSSRSRRRRRSGRAASRTSPIRFRTRRGRGAARERAALMRAAQHAARRHPARAEHVRVRAALQRLPREPRRLRRQHRVLRLHERRAVPRGCRPRRHRPVLPGEDRRRARAQPAVRQAREEEARLHLLPDVRRAAHVADAPAGIERVPDCHRRRPRR